VATGKDVAAMLTELGELVTEHNLSRLDFDELRQWLTQAADLLTRGDSTAHDLQLMRDDYQARIAGMLKAVAAAERNQRNLESLADLISALDTLTVDDLLRTYRRTSAIFRDRFPTMSFPS
jgi:hypothetical protein